jgi:predicted glycosyltransferase
MGNKQIKFNSYTELFYLHRNYFHPNSDILKVLGVNKGEKYVILRFVSWGAGHDIGYSGFKASAKVEFVKELSKYLRVFITSESDLPPEIEEYRIRIKPHQLHEALKFAFMYIGEGGTTASEASILGIPTLYINSLPLMGYLKDENHSGILHHFKNEEGVLDKALKIISDSHTIEHYQHKAIELLDKKIDPTAFLVWFIENYPHSVGVIKENPDYQYNFK